MSSSSSSAASRSSPSESNDIWGITDVRTELVGAVEGVALGVASGETLWGEAGGGGKRESAGEVRDGSDLKLGSPVGGDSGDGGFGGCLMKVERKGHMGRGLDWGLVPSAAADRDRRR
jgi:hypothetical protein